VPKSRSAIWVGAGPNAPVLTTLVSVSPVYVNFEIDEQAYMRYAARGANGNSGVDQIAVAVGLASEEGYPHRGYLKSIDNQVDTSSGTVRVRAVVDNASGILTPGLFARVRMGGAPDQPRLLVDDRAVGTDQDKKFVMVLDSGNRVKYRPVTLGPVTDGLRIVRSGLHKGEQVVVERTAARPPERRGGSDHGRHRGRRRHRDQAPGGCRRFARELTPPFGQESRP